MDFNKVLNDTVREIPPSGIRKFFDLANQMEGVISLGVGEPDFDTPWKIREAAIYSIEQGKTFYTANQGLVELKFVVIKKEDLVWIIVMIRNVSLQLGAQRRLILLFVQLSILEMK